MECQPIINLQHPTHLLITKNFSSYTCKSPFGMVRYILLKGYLPKWWNWQTRTTQNRVGLSHEGSIPSFGTIDIYSPIYCRAFQDNRLNVDRKFVLARLRKKWISRAKRSGLSSRFFYSIIYSGIFPTSSCKSGNTCP
jgi:hypothetical protein